MNIEAKYNVFPERGEAFFHDLITAEREGSNGF